MLHSAIKRLWSSPTVKNGAIFTFFAFCNNGIGFVLLLILANYIDPDEYGTLNLFNTFIQLFTIFICLGTTGYVAVSFFKKNREELKQVIGSVLLIATGVLFFFLILLTLFSGWFEKVIGLDVKYQWIALLVCYCQVYNTINLDIWRLEEKPVSYGIYSLSFALLNFVLTLLLVISFHQGWLGRLYSQTIVAIVYFIISILFLFTRGYVSLKKPGRQFFKESLDFGLPLVPHQASGWLKQGADRYIINYFLSVSTVGLYSFALNFSNIITIIGTAFNATNSVYIYKNLADGYVRQKTRLRKQEHIVMLIFAAITIFVALCCYIGIPLALPKYAASSQYILPLCLSALFGCYYMVFVNYLFFYGKTKGLMVITFSASLLHVIISFCVTRFGALFTAYTIAFTQFITFSSVYFYSMSILKKQEQLEYQEQK